MIRMKTFGSKLKAHFFPNLLSLKIQAHLSFTRFATLSLETKQIRKKVRIEFGTNFSLKRNTKFCDDGKCHDDSSHFVLNSYHLRCQGSLRQWKKEKTILVIL